VTRVKTPGVARVAAVIALSFTLTSCYHQPRPAVAPSRSVAPPLTELRHDIDAILSAPALQDGHWGILIRSLGPDGSTLYALNDRKLMMPASSLKIVTLAAAGERLGWDFRYETRLVTDGPLRDHTLEGNLVVVGSGDPSLDRATLDSWAEQLRQLGVEKIEGGVMADSRAFGDPGLGFGWSWDDLPYYYAAPIAAAQFHENEVDITLTPGPTPGAPVAISVAPGGSGLEIDNQMHTEPAGAPVEFVARRAGGSASVRLEGTMPVGTQPVVRALSVPDPPRFLASALMEALQAKGIRVDGAPGAIGKTRAGGAAFTLLISHRSPPLSTLARRLMEVSQNQYAETLVMTLAVRAGIPTFDNGLKVVGSVLASWELAQDQVILRDGSGLSRYNYISPDAMVGVLTHLYGGADRSQPFFSSLNLAGRSGTLATRLRNTAADGHVRAKDGSMAGVRSLCGIIAMPEVPPLAFAIFANGFAAPGPTITAAIDAIVLRLASYK
jgi:D-alanyl-D-alanine carboxypeptidase/D-alanyl-D-alanine-endopeptidase (penicillin-binding protein 4)